MSSWSLRRRLGVAFAAVATVVLAVLVVAGFSYFGARTQQREVIDGYYQALTASNDRFVELIDAENAVRGYLISGDPAALEPLREMRTETDDGTPLEARLAGDPEALAALERARGSAQAWWTQWAQPAVEAVEREGPGAVSDAEAAQGEVLFQRLRSDFTAYIGAVRMARDEAVATLHERMAWLFAAVLTTSVVGLGGLALLAWLLHRWVTAPLTTLADQTRSVRRGTLDHPVSVVGTPEITRLARDVDDMRRALLYEIDLARGASEELARAKEALEDRTADLERSNRELEQFAYVASHDLQEPLRKVASFTQMLQRRYSGQLDDRADQYIDFAVDGAKRMQQLINDLLQFSRVGRVTAAQTEVDLDACLDRALRDLETRIEENGATVTRDPLPVVRGEAPLLTQVLVNLVGNAIKFRSDEAPRVHVGARRDGDSWRLTVSDNGIGIEQQYAERVFVLFQRLHPKEVYGGTGIGLALSRKIVEYHGGTIALAGQDGPGTTIEIVLPATAEPSDADAPAPAPDDRHAVTPVSAGARTLPGGPHGQ